VLATLPELRWTATSEGATDRQASQPVPDGEGHHHTAEATRTNLGLRGHGRVRLASAAPLAAAEVSVSSLSPSSQAGRLASTRSPLHPASPTADHEHPHEQLPPHPGRGGSDRLGCLALRRCACALRTAVGSPADRRGDAVGAQRDAEDGSDDPQDRPHRPSPPSPVPREPRDFDARTGRDEPDSRAAVAAWPKAPTSQGRLAAERPPTQGGQSGRPSSYQLIPRHHRPVTSGLL
jgi:hypothetical protein